MTELEERVRAAAQKYYTDGTSELSDDQFDELVAQLADEEPDSELFRIGFGYETKEDTTPGVARKHLYGVIGSLDKAYGWKEIPKVYRGKLVDVSAKLDGLSCVAYYRSGELVFALTRGDGSTGIDITDKFKVLGKESVETYFTGAIRGELIISVRDYQEFKFLHPDSKNPRNSAVGLINSKGIPDDLGFVSFVPYSIVGLEGGAEFRNVVEMRKQLEEMYGQIVPHTTLVLTEDVTTNRMETIRDMWADLYPVDGLVVTQINELVGGPDVAYEAFAYKFAAESAVSTVVGVNWNFSKTGYAIPTVQIEPVQISGTTVQFATGYNAQYIYTNKVGVGAVVRVSKHGEIIPNIDEVVTPAASTNLPTVCPHCNKPLNWVGVHIICENVGCPNANTQDLLVWVNTLSPVKGLGSTTILKYFRSIYGDKLDVDFVMTHTEWYLGKLNGSPTDNKIRDIFRKLTGSLGTMDLVTAIQALNIPRFSTAHATKLAEHPQVLQCIMNTGEAYEPHSELVSFIGKANADAIRDNVNKVCRLNYISKYICWAPSKNIPVQGRVAITGKLSCKRADFEQELKSAGFKVGEMSKSTNYLITNDTTSGSSKNKQADEWGVEKLTETEFRSRFLGGTNDEG